jgi:ribose-phosphate pyrophosphokinase
MDILNLDANFKPFSDLDLLVGFVLEHKTFNFLGGEPHIQILSDRISSELVITQRFNNIADLFNIVLANDAAKRKGYETIHLYLPYFPAARQDRVCNPGEPLTVKVFTDIINSCGFKSVKIFRPHSEVVVALLDRVIVVDLEKYHVQKIVQQNSDGRYFNIVCPDAGAGKSTEKIVRFLIEQDKHRTYNLIRCEKIRDVTDGKLLGFTVHETDDLRGYPTLIVDDICAMGGTFIGLAKKLRTINCGKLMLYTSHADCMAGLNNVASVFDKVYITNSKQDWPSDSVINVINL